MKKRQIYHILLLLIFGLIFNLFFVSVALSKTNVATLLKSADKARLSLYSSPKKMKFRHHWENCINRYENIYKKYSKYDQAVWAMFQAARMHVKLYDYSGRESDLDHGKELFETIIETYPKHRLADDSQYRIGEIFYVHKKNPTQAYVEFLKVDIKFPMGDMRPKAKQMMDKLSALLGKKEKQEQKINLESKSGLAAVRNIRHWSTPTYTRVVIDVEKSVKYSVHLLPEDTSSNKLRRLFLDLENTYVSPKMQSTIPIKDGLLQTARAGLNKEGVVRVVLDINNIGEYKIFRLHDPFRIVVDVRGKKSKSKAKTVIAKTPTRKAQKGVKKVRQPDKTVSLAGQLGLSVKRIVIDPGHGGKDPGTYHNGVKEKFITLNICKKLAAKIKQKLGCEVLLTRDRDKFITLDERTAFANIKKADLFISLHVNAHRSRNIYGVETYFLNMATDKQAVLLAARENATSEKNISDLQSILNDLMLNTKISESSKLAYEVQEGMIGNIKNRYKKTKSLGVKQAPFYVLIGAEMPAILIETGFITNVTEGKRLISSKYQDYLADGIVSGIGKYIEGIDLTFKGGG